MTPIIRLHGVEKNYGSVKAVDNLNFDVEPGTILALLGASGCGKTTTLRLLAGLERPDRGDIWLANRKVAGRDTWVPPEERSIGMVFQDYALFPHMDVRANIAFPLSHLSNSQRKQRIQEMLKLVGLSQQADRHPHELSGGQQQRVALARALAPAPAVILLDEPFSNLDAALRRTMREEVRDILKAAGATAVFVTHDQEEALSIADRVAVMREGCLPQIGTPQEIYLHPVDRQMATFLGDANFLPGTATGDAVQCVLGTLPLLNAANGSVDVMIRPESLVLSADPTGTAIITSIRFYGHDQTVSIQLDNGDSLDVRTWSRTELQTGVQVRVEVLNPVLAFPDV